MNGANVRDNNDITFNEFDIRRTEIGSSIITGEKDYRSSYEDDKFFTILFIHNGSILLEFDDGKTVSVGSDYIYLMPGSKECRYKCHGAHEARHTYVKYFADNVDEEKLMYLNLLPNKFPADPVMVSIIRTLNLCDPYHNEHEMHTIAMTPFILQTSLSLFEYIKYKDKERKMMKEGLDESLVHAIDYIEKNYKSDLSLKRICAHMGVSKTYLFSLFRRHNYPSPIEYMWIKRTDEALKLLAQSELKYKDIARMTGFKTNEHFYQRILRYTGVTPAAYRRESIAKLREREPMF